MCILKYIHDFDLSSELPTHQSMIDSIAKLIKSQTTLSKFVNLYFRPPSGMAVSRSYPRHFFPFCEKKRKKHSAYTFSSFASFLLFKKTQLFLLVQTWLSLAQLGPAWPSLAQLGSAWLSPAWFSSAQLG